MSDKPARSAPLGKLQRAVINHMKQGHTLCHQQCEPLYFIDGGERVEPPVVRRLLARNLIRPANDGLIPGINQTYELVEI